MENFIARMKEWQSESWHTYASYTHDGGSRLEVNGLGKWRVFRNGELVRTSDSADVVAQVYLDLMPARLRREV